MVWGEITGFASFNGKKEGGNKEKKEKRKEGGKVKLVTIDDDDEKFDFDFQMDRQFITNLKTRSSL